MTAKNRIPVILASASPRRIDLMKEWRIPCRVLPSRIHEKTVRVRPHAIVRDLALQKARSVAAGLKEGIVIGADTIVVLRGKIIGKPRDHAHSLAILKALNGSVHRVYSGVAAIDASTGREVVTYEVSRVKMRRFTPVELERLAGKHMDKAGAYAVQEKGDAFVEKIEGDYFNVVGMPYGRLREVLAAFGLRYPHAGRRHGPTQ